MNDWSTHHRGAGPQYWRLGLWGVFWIFWTALWSFSPWLSHAVLAKEGEVDLLVWHMYGANSAETKALNQAIRDFERLHRVKISVVPMAREVYTKKLTTDIPQGIGPDLFIGQHDQLGYWAKSHLVMPLDLKLNAQWLNHFHQSTKKALTFEGKLYGIPMTFKSTTLIYNKDLVKKPPQTTDELLAYVKAHTHKSSGHYALVYEVTDFFYHSAWMHGYGGGVTDPETGEVIDFATPENVKSFAFAQTLAQYMPHDLNFSRVKDLFKSGQAEMVISGPWFLDHIEGMNAGAVLLPIVSETGKRAMPYVTIEGVYLSSQSKHQALALELMKYLAGEQGSMIRATQGKQTVAYMPIYERPEIRSDPFKQAFFEQLKYTVPTSNRPEMSAAWEPLGNALQGALYGAPRGTGPYWLLLSVLLFIVGLVALSRMERAAMGPNPKVVRGALMAIGLSTIALSIGVLVHALSEKNLPLAPLDALMRAEQRYHVYQPPKAIAANPAPYIVLFGLLAVALGYWAFVKARKHWKEAPPDREEVKLAALFVSPAAIAILILIVAPFAVGSALSLFAHQNNRFIFVGLENFYRLFTGASASFTDTLSFYFTLVVTVLWTALNVALHVTIGLGLALMLRDKHLKFRGLYRVLLIVPWAVPNYITALIWKGMFNAEVGAINKILEAIGLQPVYWFDQFITSFTANLVTNTWLGFPFMMVVTLGALQSIPSDLEDAAAVDGASRWQRFRHITLPLLKPALLPAVVLGSVWTFNMFNIIYLVSQGMPDGSTEILISESYKWAFERQFQYGYAAAYAMLIFFILVGYSRLMRLVVEEHRR